MLGGGALGGGTEGVLGGAGAGVSKLGANAGEGEIDGEGTEVDGALGGMLEPDNGGEDLLANEVNKSEIVRV